MNISTMFPTPKQVEKDQLQHRLVCAKCGKKLGQPGSSPAIKVDIGVYQHKECGW